MTDAATRLAAIEAAPLRKVQFWQPELKVERRPDGTILIRQAGALGPYPDRLTDRLVHFARTTPDSIFLADRGGGEAWRTVTYAEALDRVRRLGEGLLRFGLSADRPLVILSGNDIEHAPAGSRRPVCRRFPTRRSRRPIRWSRRTTPSCAASSPC